MLMKVDGAQAAGYSFSAVVVSSVGVGCYLALRHLRALDRRVRELELTAQQQATALEWLTRRTDCLSDPQAGAPASAVATAAAKVVPLPAARRGSSRDSAKIARVNSWESMASEAGGYKTAEEDMDEGEAPAPAPTRAQPSLEVLPASPGASPSWGTESMWSCVPPGGAGALEGASPLPESRSIGAGGSGEAASGDATSGEGSDGGWAAVTHESHDASGIASVVQVLRDVWSRARCVGRGGWREVAGGGGSPSGRRYVWGRAWRPSYA